MPLHRAPLICICPKSTHSLPLCISQTQQPIFSPTITLWIATHPCVFLLVERHFPLLLFFLLRFWIEGEKRMREAWWWTRRWENRTAIKRKLSRDGGGGGKTFLFSNGNMWKSEAAQVALEVIAGAEGSSDTQTAFFFVICGSVGEGCEGLAYSYRTHMGSEVGQDP